MKKISQKDIDHIIDNIDIVDLVSEYVKLEKRGKNYIGLCPFHNEKTPSFSVSQEKKIAHCFGCGSGGNIFQFLSQLENITYNQAIVKLGNRLGLELEDKDNKKISYDFNNKYDIMYYSYQLIADYYNYILLNTSEAETALKYLLERGITKESIKFFNIGYAPKNNIALEFFKKNNIDLNICVEAGLINKSENKLYSDVFNDRITFPIKDDKDRIVAFSGRTMSNEKSIPKYYNTQETEIFEKRKILYNFSNARSFAIKENNIILCEGYMDVISAYQHGVKNVVALMGTNIDDKLLNNILNISNKIILSLDNDDAGIEATIKIGNKLLEKTDNIFKIKFINGKDIDEFIKNSKNKNEDFSFLEYTKNNIEHFLQFKIDYYSNTSKNNIDKKLNYKNEILENISFINDQALKDILVKYLADSFSIEKTILLNELKTYKKHKRNNTIKNYNHINLYKNIEYDKKMCKLFKYFFNSKQLFLENYNEIEDFDFENSLFNNLFENLIVYYNNYSQFKIHKFISNITNQELIKLATYIDNEDFLIEENPTIHTIKDYIEYFKRKHTLNNSLETIKENLKNAVGQADLNTQIDLLIKLTKYKK